MIVKVYSVFDSKSEAFGVPMFRFARGAAIREFSDLAANTDHDYGKHPGDYSLFELGDFDTSTAGFSMHTAPINLGTALELVSRMV